MIKTLVLDRDGHIISIEKSSFELQNHQLTKIYSTVKVDLDKIWFREIGANLKEYYYKEGNVFRVKDNLSVEELILPPSRNEFSENTVEVANRLDPNRTYNSWKDVCDNFHESAFTKDAFAVDGIDFNSPGALRQKFLDFFNSIDNENKLRKVIWATTYYPLPVIIKTIGELDKSTRQLLASSCEGTNVEKAIKLALQWSEKFSE